MTRDPLTELTAAAAIRAIRDGEVRAEAYARALLAEAAASRDLNAFIAIDPDAVVSAARQADRVRNAGGPLGPLHGLPIAVKDSVDTATMPTTNGTASLRDVRPSANADVVTRLVDAGAIVLGKTNLTELSFGWTSNNGTFGAVHNPYEPDLVPGGSSGGSAAAVAARIAPLAIGADTLGSIRIPASFCGVAGFRPTIGRYPNRGVFGLTHEQLDQVGPLARTVDDIALFDAVVTGDETPLTRDGIAGARIGVAPFYLEGLEDSVRVVTEEALARLCDAGAVLVEADVPADMQSAFDIAAAIMLFEAMPSIERFLRDARIGVTLDELVDRMHPDKREFFTAVALPPGRPTQEAYDEMRAKSGEMRSVVRAHFVDHDIVALVYPAVGAPPPPIGEEHQVRIAGEEVSFFAAFGRNTALASAGGMPALTLPAGLSEGALPVGIEFAALPGADRALLGLGAAVERALGFRGAGRPPVAR